MSNTASMPGNALGFRQVTVQASCPAGSTLVGGGAQASDQRFDVETSNPVGDTTWEARVTAGPGFGGTVTVYALCAEGL